MCRTLVPDTELLVLHFQPEFLGEEAFEDISWLSLFVAAPHERPRVAGEAMRKEILRLGQELRREIEAVKRRWIASSRLLLLQVLFTISRDWDSPLRKVGQHRITNLSHIVPAVELVQNNYDRRITLTEAAAACSLSVSQFLNIFRNTMGLTFSKFALRHRLAKGAQLLLGSDLPLDAIAYQLGFEDASHFHHTFSKYYGATPARYREDGRRLPEH
jgi:AraC-like DNA-binding protein